jgi:HIV Tat-specific factor 1
MENTPKLPTPTARPDAQGIPTGSENAEATPAFVDPRVHFDKTTSKWQFEDDDGREYEWIDSKQTWTPIIDEDLWATQQAAYSIDGVDENVLPILLQSFPALHSFMMS